MIPRMLNTKYSLLDILKQLGVAAIYALLLYSSSRYLDHGLIVARFEPSSGLALAALLIGGKRYAWSVLLGAILVNSIYIHPFWESVIISSCDTLQALFGAWLLTRDGRFNRRIQSMRDYLLLILLGGCVAAAGGAMTVNTVLLFFRLLPIETYLYNLVEWWMSDTLGVILIAPLILIWWGGRDYWREAGKMMEAIFLIGLVILFGQIIFLDLLHDSIGPVAQDYWMFLVFAFVAVRLGSRGTVIALVVVAVQALSGAIQGIGYFADDIAKTHLVNYWFYLLTLSITNMALATYFTEKKQIEEALIARNERFQKLFDRASDGIVILSPSGKLVNVNESFARMHGYTTEEMRTMNMKDLDAPEALELLSERIQHLLSGELMTFEVENYHKDGHVFPLEVSASLIFIDGKPLIQSFVRDITERKQAEKKLSLAASVFTYAREGIMIAAADGSIIDVNDAFSRITGYSLDEIQGRNPHFLSSGRQGKEFYVSMWRDLIERGNWCGEIWNRHKNGEVYAVLQTISAVRGDHGDIRQYVALFSDITLLKERERKLEHIAHFDTLTDLPNRVLLIDRLHQGMAQAQRRERLLVVVFLDLDGFKAVNDNYGHEAGDQLLIALAARMKQALREVDTFARLGGDEFVAGLLDLADSEASVPMLTRLLAAAAQPLQVGELVLQVSASLGVTFYPQAEDIDADQLLRQADQAMYQAKLAGRNRYHSFDVEQDRSIRSRHESLERIRQALAGREFVLYYQPKVNMRTGTVIGAEALIRWQHPEKGMLPPAAFLPIIENHPLAVELGEWVIDSALTQMELWQTAGLDISVSVNVCTRQLQQPDFVERLHALLEIHPGVKTGDLVLEVLETSVPEDLDHVSQVINSCRKIGVMFALDDFGTGYFSLTYLKRLPVLQIKIDRSFVCSMLDSPDDLAILEGVLGLAAAFQHQVVAEGVEAVENGEMLLQLGCELAQGYSIARPMPAHEIFGWSAAWRTDPSWGGLPAVSRDDFPLLFASIEHRAWIAAVEAFLKGESEFPPPMDRHRCRFGMWLDAKRLARSGTQPAFEAIEALHRQVHVLGAELLELQARGRNSEALARLGELHGLRDASLGQLKTLARENR